MYLCSVQFSEFFNIELLNFTQLNDQKSLTEQAAVSDLNKASVLSGVFNDGGNTEITGLDSHM